MYQLLQTVVFDCCHSSSALRGGKPMAPPRDIDSQPITRSGPELDYRVPDHLDEDIWGGTRAMTILPNLKHTGSSSYVFFSACKSSELAREKSRQGCFTQALLKLLEELGPNVISCSQIMSRLDKKIEGLVVFSNMARNCESWLTEKCIHSGKALNAKDCIRRRELCSKVTWRHTQRASSK